MTKAVAQLIRDRAGNRCEYCRVPQSAYVQRFCVDHVIAKQHGGPDGPDNLAFCCPDCNLHKGPNIASRDPLTNALVALFDPRRDRWDDHFAFDGPTIVASTAVGRATVRVLNLNSVARLAVRESLIAEGLLPPPFAP